ncbi:hypothetical protein [Allokutzneria albata]|uniref:Uncharacterized protein n=1 Tax=Allokutzneria albata TaxID=211114 RepID=A0A1G9YAU8_ALLAB|nr:hypothetical protein [Allokutzneria albata]SDN06187.1 hypothetical protein SAMN04489726_4706 [Allokutzneria albata]
MNGKTGLGRVRLPYAPDDDIAAEELMGLELRSPLIDRWRAMITDEYVLQTYRVLKSIDRTVSNTFAHRNAEVRCVRADFQAGRITDEQRAAAVEEYESWKCAALVFQARVKLRLRQVRHRVRQLNGDAAFDAVRDTLLRLAVAVAEHQETVKRHDATGADRLLWVRLTTLTMPAWHDEEAERIPLAEALRQHRALLYPDTTASADTATPSSGAHSLRPCFSGSGQGPDE